MPLQLTYNAETSVPVEIEGLTPDALRGASVDDVRRFEIFHGNQRLPVGDLFRVEGDTVDLVWHFHGNLAGVHLLGANLVEGEILVHGSAGRHVGSQMRGGTITVAGDAGDWLGAEMRGGLIRIAGNAGDLVGAAYRGSPRGMVGGTILVEGHAGSEVGHTMRRGWIAIGGACGELAGYAMLAGSIFVFGPCGPRPGAGMRRGTLGLFGTPRPELLPTFRYACNVQPTVLRLMARRLAELDFPFDPNSMSAEVALFAGDFLTGGRGEVLFPRA